MSTLQTSIDSGVNAATSPFQSIQGAADAAQDAAEGARFLTEFWIEQGVCFTSGHVVHALREARGKGLMVNQRPTGQAVQDYFESGQMPSYEDGYGGESRPERKLRATTRTDIRTPVGTEVFVYGPDEVSIDLFEFELDIASAPDVSDGQGGTVSPAAALLNATPNTAPNAPGASPIPAVQPSGTVAVAHGKMVPGNPYASIHADGRLCIPRIAFEALAFETGDPITGGETLNVVLNGTDLKVYPEAQTGSFPAVPTSDRLRLHLTAGNYPVGTKFEVKIATDHLSVDLNDPS